MTNEFMAKVCHEVNRLYCEYIGEPALPWGASQAQRQSAIRGVETLLANPENTPEQQHQAWMKDKIEDGWTYGPVKDEPKKEHPCLVDYEHLPPAQRIKDQLFIGVVELLLAAEERVLPMPTKAV